MKDAFHLPLTAAISLKEINHCLGVPDSASFQGDFMSLPLRVLSICGIVTVFVLQGCGSSSGKDDGKASCGKRDLLCRCKADCVSACHDFNVTKMSEGEECASCMTSKCTEEAKNLCPEDQISVCHNCITEGAVCWATTWPSCVKQCLQWWEPIECTQCWLSNYTSHCLGKYEDCFQTLPEPSQKSKISTTNSSTEGELVV